MLSCKEVAQLTSQSQDRRLTIAERVGLRIHLFMCNGCENFVEQMKFIRNACIRFRTNLESHDT